MSDHQSCSADSEHDLYRTGDAGAPDAIKDRNGEVVLGLCKRCGRAEIELSEPCVRGGTSKPPSVWQTVPLPATPEMIAEAERVDAEMRAQGFANAEPEAIYYAMLDAAPRTTGHITDVAQAERVWHRKDCPFCGSPDGQYSASLQDLPAAFFCKGCGINAAQPPAAPVETCKTCNGRREVGGFDRGDNAYRSEPCPECSPQRSSGARK